MTDQTPEDRLTQMEQRQQREDETVAPSHELLLLVAQSQQQTQLTLDRTAIQQAVNTRAIAALKAILRARFSNGHTPR